MIGLCAFLGSYSPKADKSGYDKLTNTCERQRYEELAQEELCNKYHIKSNKYRLYGPGF